MHFLQIAMMVVYVAVLIYIVLRLGRFVRAVEHIARIIETSSKT